MKLSKDQIEAIVRVIAERENEKLTNIRNEKIKKLKKERAIIANKWMSSFNKLPDEFKTYINKHTGAACVERIVDYLVMKENVGYESFNRGTLRNKVVIASIDSSTLEELKKKLNLDI